LHHPTNLSEPGECLKADGTALHSPIDICDPNGYSFFFNGADSNVLYTLAKKIKKNYKNIKDNSKCKNANIFSYAHDVEDSPFWSDVAKIPNSQAKVVFIGHSWGAHRAIQMCRKMSHANTPNIIITLDPVVKLLDR